MITTAAEDLAKRMMARSQAADRHRELLHKKLVKTAIRLLGCDAFEAHFRNMPQRYWLRVDEPAVRWHLRILWAFYAALAEDGNGSLSPVVRARHFPERGFTEVAICTWDRVGLLAKVAGAFAEAELNIVRADIYTRSDNVVLDVFHVCVGEYGHVADPARLGETEQLLASLCNPTSATALLSPVCPAEFPRRDGPVVPNLPVIAWDNEMSDEYTVLHLEASDRAGLLYRVFSILAQHELSVAQSVITTQSGVAGDVFFVTDPKGAKITDAERRGRVTDELRVALA